MTAKKLPMIRTIRLAATLVAIAAVLTACATTQPLPEDSESSPTTTTTTAGPSTSTPDATIPDTPVGTEARWVFETLEKESGPSTQEAKTRFAEVFLAQVPADLVADTFDQIRALGPFRVESYEGDDTTAEVGLAGSDGTPYRMTVDLSADGRIGVLAIQAVTGTPDVSGWDELDSALAETGADVEVYAARMDGSTWDVRHRSGSGEPAPLGSIFKLYVLGAVQTAVLRDDVGWDDLLTVTDDLRSLPTGDLQDEPSGTEVTVAEAAEKMISISDNTATDMLIDLVGRDAVEEVVAAMGHHDPESMRPLMTTRELFQVGWTSPDLRTRYRDADIGERRRILAALPDGPLDLDEIRVSGATWPDGVDWFATTTDVGQAHHSLQVMAADDPSGAVRRILSVNPGVEVDPAEWSYAAFKGGSGPGVLGLSWYLEDDAGTPHTLVVQLASESPGATANVEYVAGLALQGIGLLGRD